MDSKAVRMPRPRSLMVLERFQPSNGGWTWPGSRRANTVFVIALTAQLLVLCGIRYYGGIGTHVIDLPPVSGDVPASAPTNTEFDWYAVSSNLSLDALRDGLTGNC